MKRSQSTTTLTFLILLLAVPMLIQAQYKQDKISIPGLTQSSVSGSPSFLGIDLSKVDFHNSYSMQVSSVGKDAVAMGLLKSSFNYTINPQVSVKGYVGLIHSPFSSNARFDGQQPFTAGLSMDNMIMGGEITYQPKENLFFHIGVNRLPANYYQQQHSSYPYSRRGY